MCPDNALCLGGNIIDTKPGFWRSNPESAKILKCYNEESNCIGGLETGNMLCSEGHIGALCEACDLDAERWSESYANSDSYSCGKCSVIKWNVVIITVLSLYSILNIFLNVQSIQSMVKMEQRLDIMKSFTTMSEKTDRYGILLKIFTNYMQIISALTTFQLDTPPGFESLNVVGNPVQQMIYSQDCFLQAMKQKIPIVYFGFIWQHFVAVIEVFLFLLFYIPILKLFKKKYNLRILLTASAIFMYIYLSPNFVQRSLQLMSCRTIDGVKYLVANVSKKCGTTEYYSYTFTVILPLFFVWAFLIPFIFFVNLRRHARRGRLNNIHVKQKYGYLYSEYDDDEYWWEFVKIYQKILIMAILEFYVEQIIIKGILVFLVIFFYGALSSSRKPYDTGVLNKMDVQQTTICAVTMIVGVFIYNNPYSYWQWGGYLLIGLLNLYFVLRMAWLLL